MDRNYWQQLVSSRISRRRGLAAASGAAAALALALSGCGGGSDSGKPAAQTKDQSGLLTKPADTTKAAKRGGIFKDSVNTDSQYFLYDQNLNGNGSDGIAGWVYSRLVQYKVGTADKLADGSVDPDLAESWEVSPDGLTVTFKVRKGLKWDNRAPTNGRIADSPDVKFSWDRWVSKNSKASSLANSKDPFAPVLSLTTPDVSTAVFKLAYPYAPLLPMLAFIFHPEMMPVEAEGGFDPRSTARGTGAWLVEEHTPSVVVKLRRNPNWYQKDRPFFDGWDIIVVPDYAQGLAQLKAGNLDTYAVRQEDVIVTKKDSPDLSMVQRAGWSKTSGGWLQFGLKGDSPFADERVRKAFSMEIDREAYLDTFSNKEKFTAAGLPMEHIVSNFAGPGFPFYLDPKGKEMGEDGKALQFNVAEAKKLLSAAGRTSPIASTYSVPSNIVLNTHEALAGGITAVGDFKMAFHLSNLQQEFIPKYQTVQGDFEGVIFLGQAESPDYDWVMFNSFYKNSANFYSKVEDPKITQYIVDQRRATDVKKREDILKDFQRYAARTMPMVPMPGEWKAYSLAQPWIGNFGYYLPWLAPSLGGASPSQTSNTYYWNDETKRKQ
jgi:peptide/nickel transport system substrate-binding protein